MKKVLFVLPSLSVGGLEREQVTLANYLDNNGYDVTIMILDNIRDLENELNKNVKLVHKPYKKHIGSYIRPIRHRYYDDGMWETRANSKQLYDYYVDNNHYDVEIAFFRGLPIKIVSGEAHSDFKNESVGQPQESHNDFKGITVQNKNDKVFRLAWVHNDFNKAPGYMNNFKSMDEVKEAYSKFDKVICVSNQAKDGFVNTIGDTNNLTTIFNMLPIEDILNKANEKPLVNTYKDQFHIVLVGRLLDCAKGQLRLINVVKRLHNEGIPISLTLVGDGVDKKLIEDSIKNIDYITLTYNQLNPYPYIKEADLLICASYYEGYNLTVAESLIIGTPVLSTNCTGPNEILDNGKYGMIVDNSEEGLYEGLKTLYDNTLLLKHYKDMTKERLEFFSEEKIGKQIIDIIENKNA